MTVQMTKREAEEILELSGTYTSRDLRQAYARLAKEFHPDASSSNADAKETLEEYMREINSAHAYIKNLFKNGVTEIQAESAKSKNTSSTYNTNTSSDTYSNNYNTTGNTANTGTYQQTTSDTPPDPEEDPISANAYAAANAWQAAYQQYKYTTENMSADDVNPYDVTSSAFHAARQYKADVDEKKQEWEQKQQDAVSDKGKMNVVYKFFAHFPYRIVFLLVILFFFIQPEHAGIDYITHFGSFHWVELYGGDFFDFLLWHGLVILAVINLVLPIVTEPLRMLLLKIIASVGGAIDDMKH